MVKQITAIEAKTMLSTGGLCVFDVRDSESFQCSHMPTAEHLSVDQLNELPSQLAYDELILVYCYHGISSQSVAQHLSEMGYNHVYSLIGGYEAWVQLEKIEKK